MVWGLRVNLEISKCLVGYRVGYLLYGYSECLGLGRGTLRKVLRGDYVEFRIVFFS